MNFDLQPYPNYKDVDIPWLGEIPAHWNVERAKRLFDRVERPVRKEDETVTCFRDGVVTLRKNRRLRGFTESLQEIGYQGVRRGDLVIHIMDAAAGAIGVSDSDGKCTPVYIICLPQTEVDPSYYSYLLREMAKSQWIIALSRGIRERSTDFRYDIFGNQRVAVPSYTEQLAISHFLDYRGKITRKYIHSKNQQLKLLNDQKLTIIQNAVINGLTFATQRKPSNIQWVGDVPAHWEVISNRRLFRENIRMKRDGTELRFSLSQRDGLIATSEMKERSLLAATHENFKVCLPGDLILNRFKAHLGVFFAAWARGIVTYHYGVFEPLVELRTKYFEYLFHTLPYRTIYAGASNGMTVGLQNLSNQNFYKIKSIVPPLDEQDQILAYIEEHTATINAAQKVIQEQINAVKEYHSKLISDVVTGKLDVREVAKNLPEFETLDMPESAPIEDLELSDELEDVEEIEDADE